MTAPENDVLDTFCYKKLSFVEYFLEKTTKTVEIVRLIFYGSSDSSLYVRINIDEDSLSIFHDPPKDIHCYLKKAAHKEWSNAIGTDLLWVRKAYNQQNYLDAIQFEFNCSDNTEPIFQLLGIASGIRVYQLHQLLPNA